MGSSRGGLVQAAVLELPWFPPDNDHTDQAILVWMRGIDGVCRRPTYYG